MRQLSRNPNPVPAVRGTATPVVRPRRRALVALVAVVGIAVAGWLVMRDQSRAAERRAAVAAARGGNPDAARRLTDLLAAAPDDVQLLDALIDWQLRTGVPFDEIEPHLNRLCAVAPESTDPLFLRAKLRVQNGRSEEGLADARRVLERDPNDLAARRLIAVTALSGERFSVAVEQLSVLAANAPSDRELTRMLVEAHLGSGDVTAADAAVARYFPPADGSMLAALLRGRAHRLAGRVEEALAAFRAAAKGPDEREAALFQITEVLRTAGRTDDLARATADLARAKAAARLILDAAQQPDNLAAQLRAAEQYLSDDRPRDAVTVLTRAAARHGKSPPLAKLLARAYRAAGRPDLATEWDLSAGS